MALINQNIKNLVAGISQQPPILRNPEQLEEQINGYSSEAGGLQKRPPSMLVSKLTHVKNIENKPLIHFVNRDEYEKYIIVFTGSDLQVYDLEGNQKVVKFEGNCKNYIYAHKPRYTLKVATIADYTFVTNTKQVAKMSTKKGADTWGAQGLLVNIKSGQYGRKYRIEVNGAEVASYETPDGSDKSHSKNIATDFIADQLSTQCADKGFIVEKGSSWLYINKIAKITESGEDVTLKPSTTPRQQYDRFIGLRNDYSRHNWYTEGLQRVTLKGSTITIEGIIEPSPIGKGHFEGNGQAMKDEIERCRSDHWQIKEEEFDSPWRYGVFKTRRYTISYASSSKPNTVAVDKTEIKSAVVYDGFNNQAAFGIMTTVQKFSNLPVSAPDGFTVKVSGEEGDTSSDYYVKYDSKDGVWKECCRPNLYNDFDNSTLPHILVREADGTFTFKVADWTARDTGDDDSNPLPSFVDECINDIFYHRNRLGFLAGENVILSRSADFFNFWITSATKLQDTDAIDLASSDSTISTLFNAVPYDEDLILFSKEAQFALKADGVLTPKDAVLTSALTHYGASIDTKPINAGRNIYFTAERALFSSVRELFTAMDNTEAKDVQDITSHVPNYIPNGIYKIIPSTTENLMLILTEGDESAMYVYKYLFIDGQRIQSSWSKWELNTTIYGGAFIDSFLYILVERNSYLCLERFSFTFNTVDFLEEPYRVLLDSKCTYKIPEGAYNDLTDETVINIKEIIGDIYQEGKHYGAVTSSGVFAENVKDQFILIGDFTGETLIYGLVYNFKITLSPIVLKQTDNNGGTIAVTEGRLQLKQMWFNYADTGYFKVTVHRKEKGDYEYIFTGREITTDTNILHTLPFTTGKFVFPVQSHSEKCSVSLSTDKPLPISIVGAGWIGNYYKKTRTL